MNPASGGGGSGSGKGGTRASGYHKKALNEIRNSLLPFANGCAENYSSATSTASTASSSGGGSSCCNGVDKEVAALRLSLAQIVGMGYSEELAIKALKLSSGRYEAAVDYLKQQSSTAEMCNGFGKTSCPGGGICSLGTKLVRKPSLERELSAHRGSPAVDSGAGSSRSDSPRQLTELLGHPLARQYSPNGFTEPPPPLPPPRNSSTPPPPPPPHAYPAMQQMLKRMSPAPLVPSRPPAPAPTLNGSSQPRGASPVGRQPMVVQNNPQVQQQLTHQMQALNLYQNTCSQEPPPPPYPLASPPPYPASAQNRQSPPAAPPPDYRKSPSSGVYSAGSASPTSNVSGTSSSGRPMPGWGSRQTKTQPPIIMQPVKSTQVQKPVLQTAIAPTALPPPTGPPSYASSIQQKHGAQCQLATTAAPSAAVPTTEPPSYASTMHALAVQRAMLPTYDEPERSHAALKRKFSPSESRSESPASSTESRTPPLNGVPPGAPDKRPYKIDHQSPIPERKRMSKEKEEERRDGKVRNYSPQAFKFFMEQHIENVMKAYKQRLFRRMQLEKEMEKIGLSAEAQCQMRKMLYQKESNYIRLKRARMDKSMFTKLKPIGVGAFGEVTLVRKIDTNHLYAMKTLRKADVLKRNQVAHVKAERDILAEADNEWVVKLYYSFQDKDNLYFVMDYIPGGDLMSLLIKFGIFEEPLARFYLAELTCAVESVHRMGFIHRDIKPDNILIDRDGHIKLTDFGLCTGFRWTHNNKYYQNNGEHNRQDSLEPSEEWNSGSECKCYQLKPLERRRRREHQRCLAHSLVGTPNYIAPEVLLRTPYTQLCDWWSVGVILYEMLLGSPPFCANSQAETQHKVINWESTLMIPSNSNVSPEGIDLIRRLCTGSDRRLGKHANEVKEHPFFAGIDFKEGVRRLRPPYTPKIHYSTDTSNFDPVDPDKLRDSNEVTATSSASGQDFHGFFEFTFRRFFDDGGNGVPFPCTRINLDESESQGAAVYV